MRRLELRAQQLETPRGLLASRAAHRARGFGDGRALGRALDDPAGHVHERPARIGREILTSLDEHVHEGIGLGSSIARATASTDVSVMPESDSG